MRRVTCGRMRDSPGSAYRGTRIMGNQVGSQARRLVCDGLSCHGCCTCSAMGTTHRGARHVPGWGIHDLDGQSNLPVRAGNGLFAGGVCPGLGKNMKEQMMENLEKSAQKNGLSSKSPQAQMMLIMQGRRLHSKESTIYVLLLLAILAHILQ